MLHRLQVLQRFQPEKHKTAWYSAKRFFLLDRLAFRLPNASQLFDATVLSPTSSRTEHSYFREKACACPTTHEVRLVRTRRKKDAE